MKHSARALAGAARTGVPLALVLLAGAPPGPADPGIEFFEKRIRPALAGHCFRCHSEDARREGKLKGGLLLDSRAGWTRGGQSGPPIVPGRPDESLLVAAIRHESLEMPPGRKLPDAVIADFVRWIEMGAPDPRDGDAARTGVDSAGAPARWTFRPPRRSAPPAVHDAAWPKGDIDRFLLARLEEKGLRPAADAPPRALLRRLAFDLAGLPPGPEEGDRFADTWAADPDRAAAGAVDRLLASPRFGERWGRHWLDVARYAESDGGEPNRVYREAWRYRDYVIDAFNRDKPYDRFLIEQLAGDLLDARTEAQFNELAVATGFLAVGQKNMMLEGEEFRMDVVAEQIDVIGRGLMGLTLGCARCHDHKFDPVPMTDYYALAGILRSTRTCFDGGARDHETRFKTLLPLGRDGDARVGALAPHALALDRLRNTVERHREELAALLKGRIVRPEERASLQSALARAEADLKALQAKLPAVPDMVMGTRDEPRPADIQLCIRGEVSIRGARVARGFLRAVAIDPPAAIPPRQSGRLQLALWLTHRDHPLTARVMVNRVWLWLMGRGLTPDVDDLGAAGGPSSHPELLDHLAAEFAEDGWSVKRLIRRIVLSRAYRLSSAFDAESHRRDPGNVLRWRMDRRRLDAEAARDAVLAVSGRLDLSRPLHGSDATLTDRLALRVPLESQRRSVYLPILRGRLPDELALFDFPDPSHSAGRREVTTATPQALFLMNSPFMIEESRHAARRLLAENGMDDAARVRRAWRLILLREPDAAEAAGARAYLEGELGEAPSEDVRVRAWGALCQALLAGGEFRILE